MDAKEQIALLIANARKAQKELEKCNQEQIDSYVRAIGKVVYDNAEPYAKMAAEESRMGVYEDKIAKNRGKSKIIWNSLKGVPSVGVVERNPETGITVVARPVGVVGAITPCTNPIVTPMCNAMFAIKGRNTIIVAPHPRTKKCNKVVIDAMNEALAKLGAPANIIQTIEEPSIEASSELMKGVDVVVATGGGAMVKSAYSSGKPAYGVGPGNVQCIIDTDADITECVPKIIAGRKFDNGIICSGEQTVIAHADQYDAIMAEFKKNKAVLITDAAEKAALREALFPGGVMNKDLVGQSVQKIAAAAGLNVPEGTPVILVEADGYGKDDLFSKEKMCPVISTYKYNTFEEAVVIARANLDVEGKGHSVSIHSNNREHLEYAGETVEVARVLVNQICSTMNGGAFTNSLTPTTTLGCCSWGNNSISENFGFKHLINYIRIAENLPNKAVPTDEEVWG